MMMNSLLLARTILPLQIAILLVGSFCIIEISCGGAGAIQQVKPQEEQREFDYFLLSLLWPATQCRGTSHCCSSNACCLRSNSPPQFTIHGLWTNYNDDTWPECCTNSKFEKKEVLCLLDALDKYWPSYTCDMYSACNSGEGVFWAHEWEKHGTCSSPVIQDEYSYFWTTLNLYFKHNVTNVLSQAGYVPSDSEKYPLGGIISAIQNAFHATPSLVCSEGAVDELRLCFYKDFKPRDCVNGSSSQSCPQYVSLPVHALPGSKARETPVSSLPLNESF